MKAEELITGYAEDFATGLFPKGCQCGDNGGGDCDWCQALWDWRNNDNDWRMEADHDLMELISFRSELIGRSSCLGDDEEREEPYA